MVDRLKHITDWEQQRVIHCNNLDCKGMLLESIYCHELKCSDCKKYFIEMIEFKEVKD